MRHRIIGFVVAVILVLPGVVGAVTKEDFEVKTTRNLINLCTVSPTDPLVKEAIHSCYGFLVGAYAFYEAWTGRGKGERLVCVPDPPPSRDVAVGMFVEWAKAHPQYMEERPVDTEFRFLMEKWPCRP
jgi:hypothetical protein